MRPLLIIPDENQKTLTLTVENFKKIVEDVWDAGYKEGKDSIEKTNVNNFAHIIDTPKTILPYSSTCVLNEDISSISNVATKRTFNSYSNEKNKENLDNKNVW